MCILQFPSLGELHILRIIRTVFQGNISHKFHRFPIETRPSLPSIVSLLIPSVRRSFHGGIISVSTTIIIIIISWFVPLVTPLSITLYVAMTMVIITISVVSTPLIHTSGSLLDDSLLPIIPPHLTNLLHHKLRSCIKLQGMSLKLRYNRINHLRSRVVQRASSNL